jgi:hypothetical protein
LFDFSVTGVVGVVGGVVLSPLKYERDDKFNNLANTPGDLGEGVGVSGM